MEQQLMITQFDRATFRLLSADITAALKAVAEKHGVTIATGNGSIRGDVLTMKLDVTKASASGEIQDKYAAAFKTLAPLYGLAVTDLGKPFKRGAKTYTITGFNRKAKEYPILAKGADGKTYKFTSEDVVAGLK